MSGSELTHLDEAGQAAMVDVGNKDQTRRVAEAEALVMMRAETLELIASGGAKKGDVTGVARIAGIMAAKRTADLIPLCHTLLIERVAVDVELEPALPGVRLRATVQTTGKTGVEMEALTAVTVAALTIYDMAKAVDRSMTITGVRVVSKSGGQSGDWRS